MVSPSVAGLHGAVLIRDGESEDERIRRAVGVHHEGRLARWASCNVLQAAAASSLDFLAKSVYQLVTHCTLSLVGRARLSFDTEAPRRQAFH